MALNYQVKKEMLRGKRMYRDKVISVLNKTHVDVLELPEYMSQIMDKFFCSKEESLKYLINWSIDKKLVLKEVKRKGNGDIINKIMNLGDLLNEKKNS